MVVVRALTTLLNFKLDTTNLKKFNNEIFGIKTRVNSIFGEISDRISTGFDFISDISKAALQTQDLAKYSGIALKDFVALQNVAGKFGISTEKVNATISKISLGIKQASRREGPLLEVLRQIPNRVEIFGKNGSLRNTRDVFFDIVKSISKIEDESERIRIAGNLLGDIHEGNRWLEILAQGDDEFKKLINEQSTFANQFQKDIESFNKLNVEINQFTVLYQNLKTLIGGIISPNLTEFLKDVNSIINSLNNASVNNKDQLKFAYDYAFFGPIVTGIAAIADLFTKSGVQPETTNNNNITVNVAPGTPEQQVSDISAEIQNALTNFHEEKIRELINNNPVYEG